MFLKNLFVFITILLAYSSYSQDCATVIPKSQLDNPVIIEDQVIQYNLNKTLSVKIYRVARAYNDYDIEPADYQEAWDELNVVFSKIGVQFDLCLTEDIPNYNYNQLDLSVDPNTGKHEENEMTSQHYTKNVINVYYVDSIFNSEEGGSPAGYAYLPGGPDIIVLTKSSGALTLIHEMGHFFGLYHTFEAEFGFEYVNAQNCATTGDLVCDTPADIDIEVFNCRYNSLITDPNGDYYTPFLSNYMSYHGECRCRFTNGQYNRMAFMYLSERSYLW